MSIPSLTTTTVQLFFRPKYTLKKSNVRKIKFDGLRHLNDLIHHIPRTAMISNLSYCAISNYAVKRQSAEEPSRTFVQVDSYVQLGCNGKFFDIFNTNRLVLQRITYTRPVLHCICLFEHGMESSAHNTWNCEGCTAHDIKNVPYLSYNNADMPLS